MLVCLLQNYQEKLDLPSRSFLVVIEHVLIIDIKTIINRLLRVYQT
jgi:hypothetical protein